MNATGRLVLTLMLALVAGAAAAQGPAPPAPPGTTVSGVTVVPSKQANQTEHERYEQSLNFISSHGQTAHIGQLAHWPEPVCPVALGLSPQLNQFVADRVKQLAFEIGAPRPRRRDRCRPNIEILFTDQPQALMDLVAKKRNQLLGFHYVANEHAVTRIVRPIQAWYLTQTVSGAGNGASVDYPASLGTGQSLDLAQSHMPAGCAGSAFSECLSSQFVNILIVADVNALSGREIEPVADYISLISLAQFKMVETCDATPTLLDMFTPACAERPVANAPARQDVGYLKALYGGPASLKLWLQKSEIALRMARSPPPGP